MLANKIAEASISGSHYIRVITKIDKAWLAIVRAVTQKQLALILQRFYAYWEALRVGLVMGWVVLNDPAANAP